MAAAKMSTASKTAIGGMAAALSVVILIPTALDLFVYALPAFAGMITLFCVIELNKKWAFGVFSAAALLSLVVVPNKEAAVLYVTFFGYYPVLKSALEKCRIRAVEYLLKLLCFNVSVVLSYLLLVFVFGISVEQLFGEELTKAMYIVLPVLMNIMFVTYDLCLTRMYTVYIRVWQKRFHKMFRFR